MRTLNDNQLLILRTIAKNDDSLTSLLKILSREKEVPLSTLKLNARILRELNLISYGSIHRRQDAKLEALGHLVWTLLEDDAEEAIIQIN